MSRTIKYVHVNIILDFPITYKNASVLHHSECACLHQTVNMVVFFFQNNENTYSKGRALMQMYRVVPQTKRGNGCSLLNIHIRKYLFLHVFYFHHCENANKSES